MAITLPLSETEEMVVRRSLNALRGKSQLQMERNERVGWKPEPGRLDIHAATIETIDGLFDRINELNPRGGR